MAFRQRCLKEVADHAEIERFAEAPGAGYKMHFAWIVDEILDKVGFVDKIAVFSDEFPEIANPFRNALLHGFKHIILAGKSTGSDFWAEEISQALRC